MFRNRNQCFVFVILISFYWKLKNFLFLFYLFFSFSYFFFVHEEYCIDTLFSIGFVNENSRVVLNIFFFSTFIPIIFFSTVLIFFRVVLFCIRWFTNYKLLLSLIKFSILIILDLLDILLIYKICIQLINTFKSNWLILSLIANILHDYWTNISICLASILDFFHYFSKISYISWIL